MPNLQRKVVDLLLAYRNDPVLGVRSLFGVEPTKQQAEMILAAWKPQARTAVSSCQGAGKTATLVWLTMLFLLTQKDCRILVTSPSYQQLSRVFHAEFLKWHAKMPQVFQDFFVITKDTIHIKNKKYQFASLVTASAENSESLQGGHSESYIVLADEASGISEDVFDLLLGTLSTGKGGRFILASNPLRSSGRFAEIFQRDLDRWDKFYFSAYDSPNINSSWIEEMAETYGTDSDIFRVRVLGRFPRASESQFIATDIVEDSIKNNSPVQHYLNFPKIMGVDVARFGDDATIFAVRQGPKMLDLVQYKSLDTMEVAAKIYEYQSSATKRCNVIFIDAIGIGAGVYDRTRQLLGPVARSVVVSNKSTDPKQYANIRSQLWGLMREWLANGADIIDDKELKNQLISMQYGYSPKMQIQLMQKKDLKRLGLQSPDKADALSLTFANDIWQQHYFGVTAKPVVKKNILWA